MARKTLPTEIETEVLTRSRRRCALCFGLDQDLTWKPGQIAHLDRNPDNNAIKNLCFLCLPHHDQYDTKPSQSKGIKKAEVAKYRDSLYQFIESGGSLTDAVKSQPALRVPESLGTRFDYHEDPQTRGDFYQFHLYCRYQHGVEPGGRCDKFSHDWRITGTASDTSSDPQALRQRKRDEHANVFLDKIEEELNRSGERLILTEEGLCRVAVIVEQMTEEAASEIPWAWLEVRGRYFAWDGPLHRLKDRDAIPVPLGLTDELTRLNLRPQFANEEEGFGPPKFQVFETDKQSWRRALRQGQRGGFLEVRPSQ